VDRELRDAFQQACASENRQASDLLREFMHSYAVHKVHGLQIGLFASEPAPSYRVRKGKNENASPRTVQNNSKNRRRAR
jgi:hypothetical protein